MAEHTLRGDDLRGVLRGGDDGIVPHTDTTPFWKEATQRPTYAPIDRDGHVDVVVVGGGVTGLTAAYLLAEAGRSVAVLERGRCGGVDTGHTTAHLTMVTDTRLPELVERVGRSHAQATWDAGLAAIAQIEHIVGRHDIDCGFERVDGYLHAPVGQRDADARAFADEAALAAELGFDAEVVDQVPLLRMPGIAFPNQARVHPLAYLDGLASAIVAMGGRIYEHSEVDSFEAEPRGVTVNGCSLRCTDIVMATHNPLVGLAGGAWASWFQTKLALYTSYVVAGTVPRGAVPDALWWDTDDPYRYLRLHPGRERDLVILGGADHKTGQEADTAGCYTSLEQTLRTLVPDVEVIHRWSGQVIETPDGLPFIGQVSDHQAVSTGYAGNGMTFGTLGAMVMTDAIVGRRNPWSELFAPDRPSVRRGLWDYLEENADYPYYLVRSRFAGAEGRSLRQVRRGEGRILERDGARVAAYRDEAGALTLRSAVCPHLGCVVAWNIAERTWDCPCHGSRFTSDGAVISGPAESPLAEVDE